MNNQQELCPCGSGASLRNCCLPFIKGQLNAPSAEALMRSRYVAYCLNEEQYLLESWHKSTRPASVKAGPAVQWIRLKIVDVVSRDDQVEFVVTYRVNGKAHKLREKSSFLFDGEAWFYLDAIKGVSQDTTISA